MKNVAILGALLLALLSCKAVKRALGDDEPAATATAVTVVPAPGASGAPALSFALPGLPLPSASAASAAPSAAPSASAAAAPAAGGELSTLFDGAPDAAAKFGPRKKSDYGGQGTTVAPPDGWTLEMPNVAIMIMTSADKKAMVFAHDEMGDITDSTVKFWTNRAGFRHKGSIEWSPNLVDGKFGEKHGPVQVGEGTGTLAKQPAKFWQIRFKKEAILIAAALVDGAPAERMTELVAAVKAVHPHEKGKQPYNPF